MKTSIIVAASDNNVIGANGAIPWRLPDDMAFFKWTTMGHHVVMGSKTCNSLPTPFLDGRPILKLTRMAHVVERDSTPERVGEALLARREVPIGPTGGSVEHWSNFHLAMSRAALCGETELFVAGGAEIYALALPETDRIYLTRVHVHALGDVYMPEIDWAQWTEMSRDHHPADARHAHSFSFITYERKPT